MYLVTGANGKLGRAVIQHLLATYKVPAGKIVAATRDPGKLAEFAARGIEVRAADFSDAAGLERTFAGTTRALIISTDSFEPGMRQKQHANAIEAAQKAGVDHVVYTSMPKPETSAVLFAPDHLNTEKALAESDLKSWTVLRHNWYSENLFFTFPQALASGTLYTAAAQGKVPFIARDDLARADAAVLASDRSGKAVFTLSGPKEYTIDEIAALVSDATGKPLDVVHVPVEGLVQGMLGAGLPEPMARMFASFDDNIAKGGLSDADAEYVKLVGRKPGAFEDWLKVNAAAF
jgi:NAD(P)H dehydrogenase (quinone)